MASAQAPPKMDLRSHTMFPLKGEERSGGHRDQVRLRLRSRHLNNTHLVERHSDIHNERQLLDARRETFRSYANVGIECPLLLSPSPRIHAARRRRRVKREKQPDVLTLDWEPVALPDNSPYVEEDPDDPAAPEWDTVLAEERRVEQPIEASFAASVPSSDAARTKLPNQKSVTWKNQQASTEDPDAWVKLVSPAYQRHLERHRPKVPGKPPFERYTIGALQRTPNVSCPPSRAAGIHLQHLSRESTLVSGPPERKPRAELHPVSCGLRQFGTSPEKIRWRQVRPGEWNVRKVWDREVSDFSNMSLMQIAREDTQQYFNQLPFQ